MIGLFPIFHLCYHHSLSLLLHLGLPKANPFASFQRFQAFCGSHSVVLFQAVLRLPLFLLLLSVPVQFVSFYCTLRFT